MRYEAFIGGNHYYISYVGTTILGGSIKSTFCVVRDDYKSMVMCKGSYDDCVNWINDRLDGALR